MVSNPDELIAPCGINCAVCAGYLSYKNNLKDKGIRMPACAGCRTRRKQCAYLKKQRTSCSKLMNNKGAFCFECADFPCAHLRTIDARYRNRYRTSLIENLNFIKKKGIENFLAVQEAKWKCPNCGGTLCCHNGLCFGCDLEKLRVKENKLRWENEGSDC